MGPGFRVFDLMSLEGPSPNPSAGVVALFRGARGKARHLPVFMDMIMTLRVQGPK